MPRPGPNLGHRGGAREFRKRPALAHIHREHHKVVAAGRVDPEVRLAPLGRERIPHAVRPLPRRRRAARRRRIRRVGRRQLRVEHFLERQAHDLGRCVTRVVVRRALCRKREHRPFRRAAAVRRDDLPVIGRGRRERADIARRLLGVVAFRRQRVGAGAQQYVVCRRAPFVLHGDARQEAQSAHLGDAHRADRGRRPGRRIYFVQDSVVASGQQPAVRRQLQRRRFRIHVHVRERRRRARARVDRQ